MKTVKSFFILLIFVLPQYMAGAQGTAKITSKDMNRFAGHWQGSLTYLDYSTGKPYTMPANVYIKTLEKGRKYEFARVYPNEPKANSTDTFSLSTDGKMLNNEAVTRNRKLANGNMKIVTETRGKDGNDNKMALIRHTYTVGKHAFSIIKEVQFEGEQVWIKRHEYAYTKE